MHARTPGGTADETRVWTYHPRRPQGPRAAGTCSRCSVEFHEKPTYDTFGSRPYDFPRVFADPGAESKHRHEASTRCACGSPATPTDRRWHHTDGLVALFNLTRNHLFFEAHWRATGGQGGAGTAKAPG